MPKRGWLLLLIAWSLSAQVQPFGVDGLLRIARISDPQVSPDGKLLAFTAQTVDLNRNIKPEQIYVMPLAGGDAHQITAQGDRNVRPRWAPDSQHIAFISNRGGSSQIWMMNADGSAPKQITALSTEAGGELFTPDGKALVFTSDVFPDCPDDACNQKHLNEERNTKVHARIYTSLLFRHWTNWQTARRSHLLSIGVAGGPVKDLTPGTNDVPPFSLGGPEDYAISPDSAELCFTMNTDPVLATSTNTDLFTVPLTGGEAKRITANPAADSAPLYSPDGKYIAYRSQTRAGYESDRWRLMLYDRAAGASTSRTETLDRSVDSYAWLPDSSRLVFTTEDRGRSVLYMIPAAGGASVLVESGPTTIGDMQFTSDGSSMIYSEESGSRPLEIYRQSSGGGSPVALTHFNDVLLAGYSLGKYEEMWTDARDGARIHSFILKPPNFRANQKYPVLFLIHGGPQGAWDQSWSYRWNAQALAGAGYVVVMPNPRGSTGFGQKFTDDINQDWGGKPYGDIMAVADKVASLPYTDPDRMAAAGGSYGGYMIDWMLGHTQRFKAMISHAGVFDLRSEAGATEELWFPIWEFHGMPWENPEVYDKWSPSHYVNDFHTPTLVITGEEDFRVPYTQSLQLYTALQVQKIPSKLLIYPDEGHWVLKPQNSVLWYNTFLEWIAQWTKKPDATAPAAAPATTPPASQ